MDEPCSVCSGSIRETVNLVCQACGTDYGTLDSLEQMRAAVEGIYPAGYLAHIVRNMSDDRIVSVYLRLKNANRL